MLLLCLSDIHGEGEGIAGILDRCPGIDAVVVVGDLTHLGGAGEAARVVEPLLAAGVRVLAVPGNMDRTGVLDWLEERDLSLHGRGVTIGDVGFFGLGGSNPTPFGTPFEVRDRDARQLLDAGWTAVSGARVRVLVSHAPPHGTRLDLTRVHLHAGSLEVRSFLLHHDVALCLCGHIHEAGGREDTVGRTRCRNPGAFKNGRYALVSIGSEDPDPRITISPGGIDDGE
jgi:Icc-related predicted phosphoesterase